MAEQPCKASAISCCSGGQTSCQSENIVTTSADDSVFRLSGRSDDHSAQREPAAQQDTEEGCGTSCCASEGPEVMKLPGVVDGGGLPGTDLAKSTGSCQDSEKSCCAAKSANVIDAMPTNEGAGECCNPDQSSNTISLGTSDPVGLRCFQGEGQRTFRTNTGPDDGAFDCCSEKPAPCCTEECVERLVVRECNDPGAGNTERCPNGITTRRFYRDLLASLGCLCRTLKARGELSCCSTRTRSGGKVRRHVGATGSSDSNARSYASNRGKPASPSSTKCNDGCCDIKKVPPIPTPIELSDLAEPFLSASASSNIEEGVVRSKHVTLSVSGMTCVGCETKLQKSLAAIKSVRNLRTSLVLCRAEFDLDLRQTTIEGVIHQLHRMTEFSYVELKQDGAIIEICPPNPKEFADRDPPKGVLSMQTIDKTVVQIVYDPSIVGARQLLEEQFGSMIPIAPVRPDPGLAAGSKHVWHVGLRTLLSAILTVPILVLAWAPLHERRVVYGSISLVLATIIQVYIAGPFYVTALKSLIFSRMIEMDLLIVISTSAAYVFSVVAFAYTASGHPLATEQFFETSTLLVTLIMLGRWLSALARQKAVESVSIRSLQSPTAILVSGDGNSEREIDARFLQYGDTFRVLPDTRVPTDGTIVTGESEIDESMITGESLPVVKRPGSVVVAGSLNGPGVLAVRLSRLPGDNTVSTIAQMVDQAKLVKPKIQNVADKVASYFVPIAIALATLTFVVWIPIGIMVRDYNGSKAVTDALIYGITVLVVSCPCAIGLAVPMVVVIAGGVAAKHGFIFKSSTTIEVARKTTHIIFDKTGTLTEGKLNIVAEHFFNDAPELPAAIYALVSDIKHPVSVAVKTHLEPRISSKVAVSAISSQPGNGVQGIFRGQSIKAGNSRWLGLSDHPMVKDYLALGYTTLCVCLDGQIVALYGLEDSVRIDARTVIAELQTRGIEVAIVSGDDDGPVSAVACQVGVTSARSRCTPMDKQRYVQDLTKAGNVTVFCGDGTNDAVALAQATIGVHMNEGTDVAQSAADVVLVRSSLTDIVTLIDLSKASMRRIAINFTWSFVYNTVAILFASGALVNVHLPAQYAGLGELVSVLPVIAIAMQLRWAKFSNIGAA